MVRCELMRRMSGCLDPSPRYTFLVSVDKFCPDSLRGDSAVHFAVKGLSVHSGLTQCGWGGGAWRSSHEADRHGESLRIQILPFSSLNHKLFFNFQILPYEGVFFSSFFSPLPSRLPLTQAGYIDMASRYPETFLQLIWNFSQTALQQIQTAKTPTGDTFFHFSPLSRLLLSASSPSVDIQWR